MWHGGKSGGHGVSSSICSMLQRNSTCSLCTGIRLVSNLCMDKGDFPQLSCAGVSLGRFSTPRTASTTRCCWTSSSGR